jgi:hypothetical protein
MLAACVPPTNRWGKCSALVSGHSPIHVFCLTNVEASGSSGLRIFCLSKNIQLENASSHVKGLVFPHVSGSHEVKPGQAPPSLFFAFFLLRLPTQHQATQCSRPAAERRKYDWVPAMFCRRPADPVQWHLLPAMQESGLLPPAP